MTGKVNARVTLRWTEHPIQEETEIFPIASCHGDRDNLLPDGLLGWYADFCRERNANSCALATTHSLSKLDCANQIIV